MGGIPIKFGGYTISENALISAKACYISRLFLCSKSELALNHRKKRSLWHTKGIGPLAAALAWQ
jgi:hypothetical protein